MKNVLITGENSYIGISVKNWLMREPDKYKVDTVDMKNHSWKELDFSQYDVVFHVAGIVHQKEKPEMKELYFQVNKDLPVEVAKKSKDANVSQFIFMSTMAVYGQEGKIGQDVIITGNTSVNPKTYYGASKLKAEEELNKLSAYDFRIVVLRPPMVYGPSCPGNYARLEKLVVKSPIFPMIENKRSVLHIDKLCQFVKVYIDNKVEGLFFPQDDEYAITSIMVKELAEKSGKPIHLSRGFGVIIKLLGRRVNFINKVFGNLVYEK